MLSPMGMPVESTTVDVKDQSPCYKRLRGIILGYLWSDPKAWLLIRSMPHPKAIQFMRAKPASPCELKCSKEGDLVFKSTLLVRTNTPL